MTPYKNSKQQIYLPTVLAIGVALGVLIGIFITRYNSPVEEIQKAAKKYGDILSIVEHDYVDTVDVERLLETSIASMLEELDPHTSYIPARDQKITQSQLEGDFEGIGVEFNIIKDTLYVITPISGGPSEKAGIKSGDKIIKVEGETIAGINLETRDVFDRLRGPRGSVILLSIKRSGHKELLDFKIKRAKIPTFSVDASYMINDSIGYIKVSRFAEKTYDEFFSGLKELKKEGMSRLIFDLRDNGGGYLHTAVNMADELLPTGRTIVYTDGKVTRYKEIHKAEKAGVFESGALIVLINANSASASEIVAGALQDNDRALIVGRRSFGKGLVQAPIILDDGSELRLTISRYYTPSGRCIQKEYDDLESYKEDYINRYTSGELFFADSINVVDSLRFQTVGGRAVYGGGGITPDDFVAKDTLGYTDYLGRLYSKNIIREYVLNYSNKHKDKFVKEGFEQFKKQFKVTNIMLKDLLVLAERSELKFNKQQYEVSNIKIKQDIKSLIVRSVWGNEKYYEMLNEFDPMVKSALELFEKAEKIKNGQIN